MSTKVASVFQTMSYPDTVNGEEAYMSWLSTHPKNCVPFLKNEYQAQDNIGKVRDPLFLREARETIKNIWWSDKAARASLLFKLTEAVDKRKDLFASVEVGTTKKTIRKAKQDVSELVSQLRNAVFEVTSSPSDWYPHGVVGIILEDTNSPSLALSFQLGPVLATGNAVVLCTSSSNSHSAFLIAETARDVGFPPGVLSVACSVPDFLLNSFDLVLGSGYKPIQNSSNFKWRPLSRPKAIVTESADIASAANGILQLGFFFSAPMSPMSGACVLVQESIYDSFWAELCGVFKGLLPLSTVWSQTGDFYFHIEDANHSAKREALVKAAQAQGAEVVFPNSLNSFANGPVLVRGIEPTSPLLQDMETSAGSQIVWVQSFRHNKEAVTLANGSPFSDYVSIWAEQTSFLMEIGKQLRATNIWVNTQNIFDPVMSYKDMLIYFRKTEMPTKGISSPSPSKPDDSRLFSKDIKNAVSSAKSAFPKWNDLGANRRYQYLFSLACEVTNCLEKMVFGDKETKLGFKHKISKLEKYTSQTDIPGVNSKCWCWISPHGVVGVLVPSEGQDYAVMAALGAALSAGNAFVVLMTKSILGGLLQEAVSKSGIPSGVINFVFSDSSEDLGELLLESDIDMAWILTSPANLHVNRPNLGARPLPVSFLDLSEYDWEEDKSDTFIRYWFQRQATNIKKIWL